MARGDKSAYTDKQKRKAAHIEAGYEKQGLSPKKAAARAWATVNAQDGGGKLSGSGRKKRRPARRKAKATAKRTRTTKKQATKKKSSSS